MEPKPPEISSDRAFGCVFSAVFAICALLLWWRNEPAAPVLLALSAGTAFVAYAKPGLLAPFNRVWMRFGLLMHRFTSPVVLGAIFFLVITPFALIMRMAGRDELRRKFQPEAKSYWIDRTPPGPEGDSFRNQY